MGRFPVILVIGVLFHGGCSWYVYDATNKPIASNIAGRCFALRENAILSEHFSYFTAYMLNLPGANECTPQDITPATKDEERYKPGWFHLPRCIWVPVASIANGTKIKVTTVTEQPYGGPGRSWEVEVKLLTGESAGITSRIPASHFDFPESELWLRMKSGHEYIEPLELSDRIVEPCAE
jgi:hypothetical protein